MLHEGKAIMLQDSGKRESRAAFNRADDTEQLLETAVLRLNARILGLVLGIIAGLGIFIATNFLILKGGEVVGPHLRLLRNFFPFYSVTFLGSIVGFIWAVVWGYIAGWVIGSIYNLVVRFKSE